MAVLIGRYPNRRLRVIPWLLVNYSLAPDKQITKPRFKYTYYSIHRRYCYIELISRASSHEIIIIIILTMYSGREMGRGWGGGRGAIIIIII